jgi:soluble lytic murein transglycosylase-like protein
MALLIAGGSNAQTVANPPEQIAATTDPVAAFVTEASARFGISASWIAAVIRIESRGVARAISPKGAMGLMQIMPQTWADLRLRYNLGADPFDSHDNVLAGAGYLRDLYDRYGASGFLAAYNAGPARYEDHLTTGRPLPIETRNYLLALASITTGEPIGSAPLAPNVIHTWTDAPLFAVGFNGGETASPSLSDAQMGRSAADAPTTNRKSMAPQSGGLFVTPTSRNLRP